ncbi:hypothetical protein [Rhodoligotrophos ferricapiens]|uniref:hypothetical protein n=1 Tax=Rhodoligotrophos ferricapiens TaxID=3069264 RepID=UPI00315D2F3B
MYRLRSIFAALLAFILASAMGLSCLAAQEVSVTVGPVDHPSPAVPEKTELVGLLRSTMIALDQANRTGNYTVFRQLASQHFQDANSAEDLAHTFKDWRLAGIDLGSLPTADPTFSRTPGPDGFGRLHVAGTLTTCSHKVSFDLTFVAEADRGWVLYGIKLSAQKPAPVKVSKKRPTAAPKAVEPAGVLPLPIEPVMPPGPRRRP